MQVKKLGRFHGGHGINCDTGQVLTQKAKFAVWSDHVEMFLDHLEPLSCTFCVCHGLWNPALSVQNSRMLSSSSLGLGTARGGLASLPDG